MSLCRATAPILRLLTLLAVLGCLTACQMPFGLGQRASQPAKPAKPVPAAGPCVVLALPQSGPYAPIAGKITRGAQLAKDEMAANGVAIRLETLNTADSGWLQKLAALPPACAVVGGPLQTGVYAKARQAGALEKRTFFTFLPTLEPGDEGARAWRMFPSPQDQVDALIHFASEGLNIRTYGAFYPNDAYGMRMTGLLEQSLASRNMLLQKAVYNPADAASWSTAVAPLINAKTPEGSTTPIPQTAFEALFLPDSWKNMEMLTTSLLYNGEDRLVLLGTTLWEQSLTGKTVPHAESYALAVFPGAWNALQAPRALQTPGTDFWTALGYDYARFAAALGLESRPEAAQVTARARRASQMIWGMAPVSWDSKGVAHQKLFIFGVTGSGMAPVTLDTFQQTRAQVLQQAALRMQGLPPMDAAGNPLAAPAEGAAAEPVARPTAIRRLRAQPAAAPVSTTPRPSYKLSLPGNH